MAPIRLLIVDDAEDARFLLRVIAQEDPAIEVVGEADGARAALELLDEARPDVVLVDARMPVHDGFEAAAMLLERRPGLALVLVTALVEPEVERRAAAAGFARVLGKDEFDRVATVVRELGASAT
jgi:DNA-binding NarL/FixJ family response regulator